MKPRVGRNRDLRQRSEMLAGNDFKEAGDLKQELQKTF
jgi:hypothetical protein